MERQPVQQGPLRRLLLVRLSQDFLSRMSNNRTRQPWGQVTKPHLFFLGCWVKRTSHITKKNYPRRKPIMGLTPDDVVRQMTEEAKHGKGVRKVRSESARQKKPVLPDARKGNADSDGEKRLPSAAPRDDAGRPGAGRDEEVSDDKRGTQLSRILKRMLGETPPAELLDTEDVGRVATNADALAAVIMREALGGRQWAIELVRDQTEGKPVRAAQMNNNEGEIEDMLDRVSQARLNQIAKGT